MIQSLFQIVSNECIARNTYKMVLSGDVSSINRPGQFVNIKLKGFFLRRPISVCDIDRNENTLTIVYKVVGKGTEFMSRLPMNEQLDVLVELKQSDLFEAVTEQYDVIVSNPPYIESREIEELMPEVKDHEPRMALDGEADGLFFYRKIAGEAKRYLTKGGYILFEIGFDQREQVCGILTENGYCEVEARKDYAGLDRVAMGRME